MPRLWFLCASALAIAATAASSPATAAVPSTMTYQGRLTDPAGLARPGTFNMTFRIFDAPTGGAELWEEEHNNASGQVVTDPYGLFEVLLGRDSALTAAHFPDGASRYLEIEVNGEVLSPRKVLNSLPFAFTSTPTDPLWQTNGTNVYRVNGRVGIGTANPNNPLHVAGNVTLGSGAPSNTGVTIRGPNTPADHSSYQDLRVSFDNAGSAGFRAYRGSNWDTYLELMTNEFDAGSDNPQTRLHIGADGQVGVGTTSPRKHLHVNGEVAIEAQNGANLHMFEAGIGSADPRFVIAADDEGWGVQRWFNDANWENTHLLVKSDGKVGIGTLAPETRLQINAPNGEGGLRLHTPTGDNNTDTAFLLITGGYDPNNGVALRARNDDTYGRKALTLHAGWDVGTHGDSPSPTDLYEHVRIASNGNVGIGTANPTFKLHVNGGVWAQSYSSPSDAAIKRNVRQLEGALEKLGRVRGVTFEWKEGFGGHHPKDLGVVAQELEDVFPELVTTTPHGKAVDYGRLTAVLIEAVRELQAQNLALQSRVDRMEGLDGARHETVREEGRP